MVSELYCVKCGVKLADTEKKCPLCFTFVYHPDITRGESDEFYPSQSQTLAKRRFPALQMIFTMLCVLCAVVVIICDIKFSGKFTWSLYVLGALVLGYIVILLPTWFKHPEPVVFVPCSFAAAAVYLLILNCLSGGGWFLSFAFPVCGALALLITALTVLLKYLKRGKLYVASGAVMLFGGLVVLIEFLMSITFEQISFAAWSLIPMSALIMIGLILLFFAICRPARESMARKLFF